jgi:hydroxysqualene synthase
MIGRGTVAESAVMKDAYAVCERLATAHDENFPVASHLLPHAMRPHVAAVYAFARAADDFADEGSHSDDERHRLMDDWLERLHRCVEKPAVMPRPDRRDERDQIFLALGDTIRRCRLPVSLFEDLMSAFRQDITTHRYETWGAVLDYCRRSANPVGRLVLRIGGYRDDTLDRASDCLCTALQLTNFWQDFERDWHRGRLYVPSEDSRRCGAREAELDQGRVTDGWRCALTRVAARTRGLFLQGRSVCDGVRGRLRLELRLTWLGGMRILSRIERVRFDVFGNRPVLSASDVPSLLWGAITWHRGDRQSPSGDH